MQRLLDPQAETSPSTRLAPHLDVSDLSSVCSPEGVARPATSLLPSEEDARSCLEAVAFHLGESQHYIDLRIFSDTLDIVYDGAQSAQDVPPLPPLQLVEVMLVLALGKQILRMELPGETFPGEGLFKGAISRLPPFSEMKRIGIPMVSILALAAIYFQNLDMPEDAHFYVRIYPFFTKDRLLILIPIVEVKHGFANSPDKQDASSGQLCGTTSVKKAPS